jgi:hypothetical protein
LDPEAILVCLFHTFKNYKNAHFSQSILAIFRFSQSCKPLYLYQKRMGLVYKLSTQGALTNASISEGLQLYFCSSLLGKIEKNWFFSPSRSTFDKGRKPVYWYGKWPGLGR